MKFFAQEILDQMRFNTYDEWESGDGKYKIGDWVDIFFEYQGIQGIVEEHRHGRIVFNHETNIPAILDYVNDHMHGFEYGHYQLSKIKPTEKMKKQWDEFGWELYPISKDQGKLFNS